MLEELVEYAKLRYGTTFSRGVDIFPVLDYAEQLRELTDKCIAIQKQERRIEKGKKTKSVKAIERLEIQVAHSQGR